MTDNAKIYKNTVDLRISADCVNDITDADTVTLNVMKPDGTEVNWTASVQDGQYAVYDTVDGDLDQTGIYTVQPEITTGSGGVFYGNTDWFMVYDYYD